MRAILCICFASAAFGQTFDAASMKLSPRITPTSRINFGGGGPGTATPNRIQWEFASLRDLLMLAYDVKGFQISGPEWTGGAYYDIAANIPAGATKEQFHLMLRNLLEERLQMKLHREQRESTVYSLVVAKGGPKMQVSPPETAAVPEKAAAPAPSTGQRDSEGFLLLPGARGAYIAMSKNRLRIRATQETMADFANLLGSRILEHPVTDDTGLTGKYDFIVTYTSPETTGQSDATADPGAEPDISGAMQQIGLKLERKKGMVDTLVIDRVEKIPIEN